MFRVFFVCLDLLVYLEGRITERENPASLAYSPDGHISQGLPSGYRGLNTWTILCFFLGSISREMGAAGSWTTDHRDAAVESALIHSTSPTFKSLIILTFVWHKARVQLHSVVCGCSPFVENNCTILENKLTLLTRVCFWAVCSSIRLCLFISVPYCLGYCIFVVSFKFRKYETYKFFFFFKIVKGIHIPCDSI